jgi:membrane protein DedA with SNARE-associated domain
VIEGSLAGWISGIIASFGYWGVAFLMIAENLFPPIPSEVILPLAGFFVWRGDLGFVSVLGAATLGSLLGALVLYALGRWGGRALILRYSRLLRVTEAELDRADDWFDRYGEAVVLVGRMVPLVRSVVSIPAGLSEMPLGRFALLTTLGSSVWNALLVSAGWTLGENWERVSRFVGSISNAVLVILLLAAIGLGIWWWRKKRAH